MLVKFLLFLSLLCVLVSTQELISTCSAKTTCGSCISSPGCIWCSKHSNTSLNDNSFSIRCLHKSKLHIGWCSQEYIINPVNFHQVLLNKPLTTGGQDIEPVQISPQHVYLSLRVGEVYEIPIKYQQAEDYPLDLYYLMDLSSSMRDDKENLSGLGKKLVDTMEKITSNLRIGFGSFVDKVVDPFTSTHQDKLQQPCVNKGCAPPYTFRNQMPLTTNTSLFSIEVKKSLISGNQDNAEGGFDALMQVIICREKIGWREKSRKLVIFATDETFHVSGDGKLGGIVEPNDGLCHLDSESSYTHALLQDYPSIAMLDSKAKENNINIIFAVTKERDNVYKMLKEGIHGASYGTLSKDSSNVVDLVKGEYEKLVDTIVLSDDAGGSVEIKYYSNCVGTEEKQTNECVNLRGRPELEFRAVVKAINCPENRDKWKQIINIKPGALNETLTMEVEIICECECEKTINTTVANVKSAECSGSGTLQCGVCSCDSGRYGKYCECADNELSKSTSQDGCKPDNSTEQICSGAGFCKCGKCECNPRSNSEERVYGTYCQCDNYSCKRNGGLVCSGPEKGRCDCGQCVCESGWSGSACECRENNATCIAPDSEEVCSGHGNCECGSCQCHMTDKFRYSGQYCEECPHCSETKCSQLKDCVECEVHKSGKYSESECSLKCTGFQFQVVDKVQLENENDLNAERICRVPDDSGCTIVFKYMYQEDNKSLKVYAQKTRECAGDVDVLAVVLGVVGSILLSSLLLLIIWKVLTTLHDRREYEKFEKERATAKWGANDNPLYKPSISLFQNPIFRRSLNNTK